MKAPAPFLPPARDMRADAVARLLATGRDIRDPFGLADLETFESAFADILPPQSRKGL